MPASSKIDICTCHNSALSELVPSSRVNHGSATTCESHALVQHMEMIRQTCSFAVQTQIVKGNSLQPQMRTEEDSHCGVTTEKLRLRKSSSQVHVRAVQQRVPVRVAVLSNSTAATALSKRRNSSTIDSATAFCVKLGCCGVATTGR